LPGGFQGYEDWLRHTADNEVNNCEVTVIRRGVSEKVRAMDLHVGNIVKVTDNSSIPCDMVLLSSANVDGRCYITSVNLDGETSLKVRF
jgi:phospholipid-translocating ATPase